VKTESFKGVLLFALVITSIMAPILVLSILTTGVSATHTPTVSIDKGLVKANTPMVLTITVQNAAGSDPIENVRVILPTVFTGLAPMVKVPKDNTVELAAPDNENVVLVAGTKVKLTGATTVTIPENTWLIRLANDNVFYENQAGTDSENLRLVDNVRIKKNATVNATGLTTNDNVITVAQTTVSLNENDVVTLAETIVVRVTGNIVRLPENTLVKVHDDTNCRTVAADNVTTEKEKTVVLANGSNWVTENAVTVVVIKTGLQSTLPAGAWVRLWLAAGESDENRVVLSAGSKVRLAAGTTVELKENENVLRVAPRATENIYLTDPASAENKPKNWEQYTGTSTLPSGPYVEWVGIADNQIAGGASLDFPFAVTTPSGTAYTIYVKTTDNKGATVQKEITLTVDNVPPTVTIAASPSWVKNNVAVTITVKASETLAKLENVMVAENNAPENTQVTMTSADNITWTGTYTTGDNWLRDGAAKIYVIMSQVEDLVGNVGIGVTENTFTVDRLPPPMLSAEYGLTALPAVTNQASWLVEGIAVDNILGSIVPLSGLTVEVRVGALKKTMISGVDNRFNTSITLAPGSNEVGVRVIDKAGNEGPENVQIVYLIPAGLRAVIYPAADVYAFSGDGARYSRSQLKFDISGIPSGSKILSAKLWLYRFAADNWDGEVLLDRVDDQLWGEKITASEFDAQTLTNEETQASKFMSPGWDYLDVDDQLNVDHEAGHAYSSYRLRWANDDGSEPSVGIDDGRFLVIESELDELCIFFPSSEYNGSDPYLEVVYVPPYAVSVSISPTYRSGAPGEELSYAVTVTNMGGLDDNYILTVSDDAGWGPTLWDNLLEVPAGESRQTTLSVTIPAGAENCTRDNITVTVISQADNTVRDNASCIAHAVRVGRIPRGPIYINGDDNFIPANGVTSGSGTENDPYIIENWDISAENANGIWVENTTLYFIVRNCYVHDGWNNSKYGIYLDPVINGIIDNNIVENNGTGIYLEYSDNNIISNNIVRKNLYDGIRLDYSDNNVIYNNTCENNSSKGIYLDLSDNNLIKNNICKNNNDHGIYLGSSYNNLIENCVVKNNQGHGIDLEPYCYNNIISNCLAENNRDWGIVLVYSDNNLIENCVAKYNMQGIALCSSNNNTITNYAGENNDWGIVLNSSQNDLIENCICMNNWAGIEFDNSSNNNVENCIAGGNSGVGIVLGTSDNNLVENCTVENSGGDGILLEYSDNNTLDNNTSKNNDSSGIRFYYSDNNLLNNCTISNNGSNGIQLNNSGNNLIENCVAKNNYGAGIAIYDNSSNNLLENNLTENDSTGIDLYYSDNNTLTNNTCLNNYNQGIRLYFSSNNLLGNNLTKNNNSKGIELENADNNIISNNIVENNNEYGIFLLDSNDDTLNNNICENNLRGIDLNRSGNNTLDNNTCANNEWDGILLEFDSDNNRISNNTCENNDGFGIYLGDSDNNRIESNTCENNGLDGILIGSSDNNLIKNCTAKNNDACGISFGDSDNNSLTNNTCENNNANGINLYHSSTNTLTNNSCSNNYSHGIMLENSDNNLVRNCTTENNRNEDGIQLVYSYNNIVENCAAENNVNTGIHLIYSDTNLIKNCVLKNNYGCAIDFYSSDNNTVENCAAENNIIWIYDSDNNLIENCTASNNNGDGIHLGNSGNNLIKSCTISNSGTNAIALDNSDNNLIDNCTIWNNYGGIALWRSMNNMISNNIAENNGPWSSIYLGESENNTVTYNTCENNGYGVWFSNSNNNHIYHNNFINNVNQAYDDGSNYWDNGYPLGGNYWSDYTGVDENHGENQNIPGSDGIGDTPYYISGGTNRDRYPLMNPWVVPPPVIEWDALITATFSRGSDDAIFGARLDASSGFDSKYDVPEPPAPPEPPYVRAYFYYPEQTPDELHRSCLAPEDLMEWPLRVEYSEGPTDITLTWSVENIPLEYSVLLYRGGASVADMRVDDNYTFEAASDNHDFRVIVGKLLPFTLELTQGWNMISFPVLLENMSPDSIFDGYYVLYRWDAENKRYVLHADSGDFIEPDPNVEVGVGYWVYVLEDENVDLLGFPVERLNLSLRQGWNLIGSPYGGSSIADPADDPDNSVIPWAFTWNAREKRYDMTQLLEAGKGYWVYTLQDCSLTMERKVTMGFVLGGYIEGSTWDGRYIIAAERLKWLYPWFDYAYDEGVVLAGRDPASSARDLIATKKANLVVGSWEPCAVPSFETIKGEYPEVWFLGNIGSDITRGGNFLRFFPRQYQAMYLEGLVAGAITRTNKIGIAVGPVCVQNYRRMAAFYLGIREVNPAATLYIKYVGEWYVPTVERDVSLALADMGCDVLTNYTDSTAPVEVCEERGIWYVGKDTDVVAIGRADIKMDIIGSTPWSTTDTVAVSFDTRWEVIWYHFLKEYLASVEAPSTLVFLGMDDGIAVPAVNPFMPGETFIPTVDLQNDCKVGVDAISPKALPLVPDNVIELIRVRREQMMRGEWDPFYEYELVAGVESVEIPGVAPPRTPGEVVKPAGVMPSDEFLLTQFNFQLEGIVKLV